MRHTFDAVLVGAGGAGLMAALQLAGKGHIAVLSKLYPTRSHTGAAQGGIGAALGNIEDDHWEWHMFDTVKGSDYLGDQDAIEIMCKEAIEVVYELEHMGLPFNRTPEGRIDQRPFGGHTRNHGEAPVKRACYAADRTGHMILQTLYQKCIQHGVHFFDEFHVLDLLVEDGVCCGVVAYEIDNGEIHLFHAKAVLFATGGYGRVYKVTSNAMALTGDGVAIAQRRGVPLEDMEFFQFHPTGIYKMGILITEGARGEGGILRNGDGERFMERYAPTLLDLAPRDMVSRAIYAELQDGRGIEGAEYVHLDLTHLGPDVVLRKLPDITDFVRTYLGKDPVKELIPVQPTAHYGMGGIPTDDHGRVVVDAENTPLPGFYAAGECACISVHGANRLGTNSLVDITVFGRRAVRHIASYIREAELTPLSAEPDGAAREQVERFLNKQGTERIGDIRKALRGMMFEYAGVVRNAELLQKACREIETLRTRYADARIDDKGKRFNTDLLEAIELGYLLDIAETVVHSALERKESRGAHYREDYPDRDDVHYLRHSLAFRSDKGVWLDAKPVRLTKFEPKERTY